MVGLDFVVFSLEFVLAYLFDSIAATIFLHQTDVPLHTTFPVMLLSTYVSMYMIYCGIGKAVGGLLRLATRRFKFALRPSRAFPINVFSCMGRKIRSLGIYIAERHPLIIFFVFVLAPIPHFPSAIIVGLRLAKPKRVVLLLIAMNFFRTILVVSSVYYFPVLFRFRVQ